MKYLKWKTEDIIGLVFIYCHACWLETGYSEVGKSMVDTGIMTDGKQLYRGCHICSLQLCGNFLATLYMCNCLQATFPRQVYFFTPTLSID